MGDKAISASAPVPAPDTAPAAAPLPVQRYAAAQSAFLELSRHARVCRNVKRKQQQLKVLILLMHARSGVKVWRETTRKVHLARKMLQRVLGRGLGSTFQVWVKWVLQYRAIRDREAFRPVSEQTTEQKVSGGAPPSLPLPPPLFPPPLSIIFHVVFSVNLTLSLLNRPAPSKHIYPAAECDIGQKNERLVGRRPAGRWPGDPRLGARGGAWLPQMRFPFRPSTS